MLNPGINVPVLVKFGFLSYHLSPNGTSGFDELTLSAFSNEVFALSVGEKSNRI